MMVTDGLDTLAGMSAPDLRNLWCASLASKPPQVSTDLLRRMLGHALQEKALGGLGSAQRQVLRRIAAGKDTVSLKPGMRLVRQWNGQTIMVTVTDDGFLWDDRTWRSLSAIARDVTGAHWSGPRFFGLADHG